VVSAFTTEPQRGRTASYQLLALNESGQHPFDFDGIAALPNFASIT
jgi:hypothetical protein